MTESNVPPPPPPQGSNDPYDTAPASAPPPPPSPSPVSQNAGMGGPGTPLPTDTPALGYANPSYGYPGRYVGPPPDANAKSMGMLCHLLSLAGYIIPIPFANVIAPLVLWQMKKAEHPFIDDQGKESVNFQITVLIAVLIGLATLCIGIGFVVLPVVGIVALVFVIIASVKAYNGEAYRYPLTLRLVK
jgi:uncharacterized Tic20 family protein